MNERTEHFRERGKWLNLSVYQQSMYMYARESPANMMTWGKVESFSLVQKKNYNNTAQWSEASESPDGMRERTKNNK